jgi:hypothetical protein
MSYKDAIAEAYASADINEVPLDTLEIRHPYFVDDSGNPTALRIVRAYQNYNLTLEPNAPMNPGQTVTFVGCPFNFQLPDQSDSSTPELKISIDNVDRRMSRYIELAAPSIVPIEITYRPYLESDPSTPQMDPPFNFVLSKVTVDIFTINGTATTSDVTNWGFPNRLYTPQDFPGLVR